MFNPFKIYSKNIRKGVSYLKSDELKRNYYLFIGGAILIAIIQAISPIIFASFIDNVLQQNIESQETIKAYFHYVIYFLLLLLLEITFSRIMILNGSLLNEKVIIKLQEEFFQKILSKKKTFFDNDSTGQIFSRFNSDIINFSNFLTWDSLKIVWGVFLFVLYISIMLYYNWKLASIFILVTPFLFLLLRKSRKLIWNNSKKFREFQGSMYSFINENINGHFITNMFSMENSIIKGFRKLNKSFHFYSFKTSLNFILFLPLSILMCSIIFSGVVLLGSYNYTITVTALTIGTLAAFYRYSLNIINPITDITTFNLFSSKNEILAQRIFSVIDEPNNNAYKYYCKESIKHIEFKSVSFGYTKVCILSNINIKIAKGDIVGMTGPSGGGKSTIAKLLARYYELDGGVILLNNKNLSSFDLCSYQQKLSIVDQNPYIFPGTILDNILVGSKSDKRSVINLLEMMGAVDLIPKLNTYIRSNEDSWLSKGEKQIVSFSRAIIKNPEIYIFDEITSSIDFKTEQIIINFLKDILQNKISLIISHKPEFLELCNKVYFINQGSIRPIEIGNLNLLKVPEDI